MQGLAAGRGTVTSCRSHQVPNFGHPSRSRRTSAANSGSQAARNWAAIRSAVSAHRAPNSSRLRGLGSIETSTMRSFSPAAASLKPKMSSAAAFQATRLWRRAYHPWPRRANHFVGWRDSLHSAWSPTRRTAPTLMRTAALPSTSPPRPSLLSKPGPSSRMTAPVKARQSTTSQVPGTCRAGHRPRRVRAARPLPGARRR